MVLLKMEEDAYYKAAATTYGLQSATCVANIAKRHSSGMAISVSEMVRLCTCSPRLNCPYIGAYIDLSTLTSVKETFGFFSRG